MFKVNKKKILLFFTCLVYVIATSLSIEDAFNTLGSYNPLGNNPSPVSMAFFWSFVGIIVLCIPTTLLFWLLSLSLKDLKPYKKKISSALLFFCVLVLSTVVVFVVIDAYEYSKDKTSGQEIIIALSQYKDTHGEYPQNLSLLTTEYLSEVPKTSRGASFFYYKMNDTFELGFSHLIFQYRYDSAIGKWKQND